MKDIQTAGNAPVPEQAPRRTIAQFFESLKDQISAALPAHLTADRLARIALTAIRQNPDLGVCSEMSLAGVVITAAQLGLELNTPLGQAYMIPRKRKIKGANGDVWIKEATFQLGYQGLLDLAYRSGRYSSVIARNVYKNDAFDYDYGIPPKLSHKPAPIPEGEPIYYYAVVRLTDGTHDFSVWSREQVVEHARKFSDSFSSSYSPWVTNFDAMARKTVVSGMLKYSQKSPEVMTAISVDRTIAFARKAGGDLILDYKHDEEDPQKAIEHIEPETPEAPPEDLGLF